MCARTGVCAETHRRTHAHTHTTRASALCAPGHSGWPSSWPSRTHSRLPATPAPAQDSPRGRLRRRAPGTSRPHGMRAWACAQVTCLSRTPPPPCFRRGGRWLTDALTTLSSGTDRLSVHSWLFTKASAKQEGNRKLDARSERPRGGIFHPGRCGRSECAWRLRLPVCILSPKRKACAAQ